MVDVLGLVLNIIGSFLLGYSALTLLPNKNERERLEGYANHLREFLRNQTLKIRALPDSAYPQDAKNNLIEELTTEFQPQIDNFDTQINELDKKFHNRTYDFGWLGVLLLVVGFVLQIISNTNCA